MNVKATYTVKVHVDKDGDMVIIQNPTLAPAIEKSTYEPKAHYILYYLTSKRAFTIMIYRGKRSFTKKEVVNV